MAKPRNQQIFPEETPYYHCISRCVRSTYLCGHDKINDQSYEHRRGWVEDRLLFLAQVFSIDVCAFAVMSNHTHIVLHIDQVKAERWDLDEVITRWHKLYKGTELTRRYAERGSVPSHMVTELNITAKAYKLRLLSISWFMKCLNEPIAIKANKEEGRVGKFWESRFTSQALLDEAALLTCMAYVDLNPIRAKIAELPESSDFTSIKQRINAKEKGIDDIKLMPFKAEPTNNLKKKSKNIKIIKPSHSTENIPFKLKHYIALVDQTGRQIRKEKRGFIDDNTPNILSRLNISSKHWFELTTSLEALFAGPIGSIESITDYCVQHGIKRRMNKNNSKHYFNVKPKA